MPPARRSAGSRDAPYPDAADRASSSSGSSVSGTKAVKRTLIVLRSAGDDMKALATKPESLLEAHDLFRKTYRLDGATKVRLSFDDPTIGRLAILDDAAWEEIQHRDSVWMQQEAPLPMVSEVTPTLAERAIPDGKIGLKVRMHDMQEIHFLVNPDSHVQNIYNALAARAGFCPESFGLLYDGQRLLPDRKIESYGISNNDQLDCIVKVVGGKPVILFYSPHQIKNASINLELASSWSFSGIYPSSAILNLPSAGQAISWTADVASTFKGGMLTMVDTGLRVSSLFWEATSNVDSTLPRAADERFDPRGSTMSPANSILLSYDRLLPYLEVALRHLSLSDTAATDMMQYWVPSFTALHEKGQRIAMRFVPQSELEAVAALNIAPQPDVITRIFLLFKGIASDDWEKWDDMGEAALSWPSIVGLRHQAFDESNYRVLEWGGMQVY